MITSICLSTIRSSSIARLRSSYRACQSSKLSRYLGRRGDFTEDNQFRKHGRRVAQINLNLNNARIASQRLMVRVSNHRLLLGLIACAVSAVCTVDVPTGRAESSVADDCPIGAYRFPDGEIVDIAR